MILARAVALLGGLARLPVAAAGQRLTTDFRTVPAVQWQRGDHSTQFGLSSLHFRSRCTPLYRVSRILAGAVAGAFTGLAVARPGDGDTTGPVFLGLVLGAGFGALLYLTNSDDIMPRP